MGEKDLTFSISKLELEAGDVLVVKGPRTTPERYHQTNDMLQQLVPSGVRILHIPPDVELSVLTKAEIDARAEPVFDPLFQRVNQR